MKKWQHLSCSGSLRIWLALIPLLGTVLLSCDSSPLLPKDGPLVQLDLSYLYRDTTQVSVAVTATDTTGYPSAPALFSFTSGPFDTLGVVFPVGTRGMSSYQVNAYSRPGCPRTAGQADLYLGSDNVFNLTVPMTDNPLCSPAATLSLIAGGLGGPGNKDGTGPAARFSNPSAVAMDGAGNLYVADQGNNTIRKVVAATGVVTTLAGTAGMIGGDDGNGATARFNSPSGVAADGAGNLYVADQGNSTIRKVVVATGVVTTLAGTAGMIESADGIGSAARFYRPRGVALDGAGNLNGDYESAYIG